MKSINVVNAMKMIAACALFLGANASFAYMVLQAKTGQVASHNPAAFVVEPGCAGSPSPAMNVRPPAGTEVAFNVLQTCESGSNLLAQIPNDGTSTGGLKQAGYLKVTTGSVPAIAASQPVQIVGGWVRSTVPGQKGTGAFMQITARQSMRLVGVKSAVAAVSEVHEMKMEADVMKMRQVNGVDLPAGVAVELKPGGFHVMLMDLKQPILPNSTVPLTLLFRDAKGVESKLDVSLKASTLPPGGSGMPAGKAGASTDHKH